MYRYRAYIGQQLTTMTLMIALSLTSIVWLTQALRLMDFIIEQGISVGLFISMTVLLLPSLVMLIVPVSLMIGILFLYHKLKIESELFVLQSAGLSPWSIALPALKVACGFTLLGALISFYVLPWSYGQFRDMQNFLRNNYASVVLQEGVFSTPVPGLTVFIRERADDGTLKGILVHDNREPDQSITMMAEQGQLKQTESGPRFEMQNGNRQEVRDGHLSLLKFESYDLDISIYGSLNSARYIDNQEKSVWELFHPGSDVSESRARELRAEGHQRIVWPFYSLTLAMVVLAVSLSGQFNRRNRWQRNMVAIGICVTIIILAMTLKRVIGIKPDLVPLIYMTALIPMMVSGYYLAFKPIAPARARLA